MENFEIETKWFIQQQGRVQGPFNTTYLQSTLDHFDAQTLEHTLVWRRGFAEWVKASKWQSQEVSQHLPTASAFENTSATSTQLSSNTQTMTRPTSPPILADDRTVVGSPKLGDTQPAVNSQPAFYKVQVNFVDQPMMTRNELLNLISKQEDITVVAIQDTKTKEWKEVYAYPDIVEKLGLSRRKHPRVPILAQFTGRSNRHETFLARIITVSEGGVGLTEVYDLKIGDEVEGQITSPHFFQPINIRADVVYSGLDGYIGLNFNQINEESQAAIIEYVKKFGKGSTNQPPN